MTQYSAMYSVSRKTQLELVFLDKFLSNVVLFEPFLLSDKIISTDDVLFEEFLLDNILLDTKVFELDPNKNWNILNLFHTFNYFHEYRNELLNIFKFKPHIQDEAKKQINIIKSDDAFPLVSLHVRRGDYLQYSSLNLTISYYIQALNLMSKKLNNKFKLLIFSDDIDWCKNNIKGDNSFYIENNSNYVDMCMMSMCNHHIIANSGFSWWGAYLNPSEDKVVICPNEYIGPSAPDYYFINGNYFPKEWLSISIV